MKVAVVGGGPAGLYFALLLKQARPDADVTVLERNRRDDTFGWGVVFSDQTLENFRAADADSSPGSPPASRTGTTSTSTSAVAYHVERPRLLPASRARSSSRSCRNAARSSGSSLRFETEVRRRIRAWLDSASATPMSSSPPTASTAPCGPVTPRISSRTSTPGRRGSSGSARRLPLDAFTFYFVENEHGVFQAHCYRFDAETSTFIVECDEASWRHAGFDHLDLPTARSRPARRCSPAGSTGIGSCRTRAPAAPPWTSFVRVRNAPWFHGQHRAHRRCRAHRAFLDRLGHQARDGGRDRAGAGAGGPEAAGRGARRRTRTSG